MSTRNIDAYLVPSQIRSKQIVSLAPTKFTYSPCRCSLTYERKPKMSPFFFAFFISLRRRLYAP